MKYVFTKMFKNCYCNVVGAMGSLRSRIKANALHYYTADGKITLFGISSCLM